MYVLAGRIYKAYEIWALGSGQEWKEAKTTGGQFWLPSTPGQP